mmetsp:Transcript_2578/g.9111  ORF Transcript_2578/g.9111 Transcript_2578/m.9111 type:complete len:287 (-) Transcript_2578:1624-2484(-)
MSTAWCSPSPLPTLPGTAPPPSLASLPTLDAALPSFLVLENASLPVISALRPTSRALRLNLDLSSDVARSCMHLSSALRSLMLCMPASSFRSRSVSVMSVLPSMPHSTNVRACLSHPLVVSQPATWSGDQLRMPMLLKNFSKWARRVPDLRSSRPTPASWSSFCISALTRSRCTIPTNSTKLILWSSSLSILSSRLSSAVLFTSRPCLWNALRSSVGLIAPLPSWSSAMNCWRSVVRLFSSTFVSPALGYVFSMKALYLTKTAKRTNHAKKANMTAKMVYSFIPSW